MTLKRTVVVLVFASIAACARLESQTGGAAVPFKLGTFEQGGRMFPGLVLRDTQVVDIAQANTAFEAANASAPRLPAPADLKQLIARYDAGWRERLSAIAKTVASAQTAPAYAYAVAFAEDSASRASVGAAQCRRQLRGAHRGHCGQPGARRWRTGRGAGSCARQGSGASICGGVRAWHLGAFDGRLTRQPVPLSETPDRHHRRGRSHRHAARAHEHRLRVRVRHRHRQAREVRAGRACGRLHLRIYRAPRRLGSRRPRRSQDGRVGLAHRQEPRHVRPVGSLHRAEGVREGSDEHAPHDVPERAGDAGFEHRTG